MMWGLCKQSTQVCGVLTLPHFPFLSVVSVSCVSTQGVSLLPWMLDLLRQVLASERDSPWPADLSTAIVLSCTTGLLAFEFTHRAFPSFCISLGCDFKSNITDQGCSHFMALIMFYSYFPRKIPSFMLIAMFDWASSPQFCYYQIQPF